jgi:hypothetical protein
MLHGDAAGVDDIEYCMYVCILNEFDLNPF